MPLLRRFSSSFRKSKKPPSNQNVQGGLPAVDEPRGPAVNNHAPNGTRTAGKTIAESLENTKNVQKPSSYEPTAPVSSPDSAAQDDTAVATRQDVEDTFRQFVQLIHASQRPLPTQSGDGQYLEHEEPSGLWADLSSLGLKDIKTVTHMLEDKASGNLQDDRKMHVEEIMQLIAALPERSPNRVQLTSMLVDLLWNSLQHPPMSYLGDDFKYRSADGSNNSYISPKLGAANTPYARSVNPLTVQPGALPDPGLLFDSLLAREEFKPHPNKVSSIFFNWASLIIHGGRTRKQSLESD